MRAKLAVAMTPLLSGGTDTVGHMPDVDAPTGDTAKSPQWQPDPPSLIPLTPGYSERRHGIYLRHLKDAITGPQSASIRNIALTGSYGIGKSSILEKLATDSKRSCVRLSLSTLGDEPELSAGTPVPSTPASITNRIQKEIVKQLLYREKPRKVRDSRFHRIGRYRFWSQLPVSALAAALLVPVIYVLHGADRFVHFAGDTLGPRVAAYVAVFTFLVIAISSARYIVSQSRIQFEKLGAGPATVTLSSKSDTYFDEYLDEIVYFFEKTKCNLVIFEDIDRFDEPHIFETLRELNTILNNSKQLKHRVRFVYAIKDSIFERLESSQQAPEQPIPRGAREEGSPRANRTKFFDLVIPVVPFITHRNARDLMSDTMSGNSSVSKDLIDLAAKHITDMRMIKNIRNEFLVFKEKLDVQHTRLPGLDDDALFALIVYKNVHLSDFEKIKEGTSNLDDLYRASRMLVESNLRQLRVEAASIKRRLTRVASIATRSKLFGDRVEDYVRRVLRHLNITQTIPLQYSYAGRVISAEELRQAEFWRNFLDPNGQSDLVVTTGYQPRNLTFSRTDLAAAFGEQLSEQHWTELDVDELTAELETNSADQSFLRTSDMSQLFQRPAFELSADGESQSFKSYAEQVLPTPLAVDLISNGYINRNFTLYVSQYYGLHVSLDAMNYLVHHVYTNEPDTTTALSPTDVESLIHEAGSNILNDRSMYNVSIVDHLVSQHDHPVKGLINNLVQWGEQERNFVSAYVSYGKQAKELYRLLSQSWPHVFLSVDELDVDIDDTTRVSLLDGALQGATVSTKYDVNEGIAEFIADHYPQLEAATKPRNDVAASSLVRNLARFGVIFPSLRHLENRVRRDVIRRHMYLLIPDNLTNALGGVEDYALDTILGRDNDVYEYVLDNLPIYKSMVEAAPSGQYTVLSNAEFIRVLQDALAKSPAIVDYIATHAAPECRVDVVTDATEEVWPYVVDARRFALTFGNVFSYTNVYGIDEHLAAALATAGTIETAVDDDQTNRRSWAIDVINAHELITDPGIRVGLVASLDLAEPLTVSEIQPQDGPLYGLLLQEKLLADDPEAYSALASVGAKSREVFIAKSTNFINYVSPELIQPDHLAPLLTSSQVLDTVKSKLISFVPAFGSAIQPESAQAIADWGVQHNVEMPLDSLQAVAAAGVKPAAVIKLLRPTLPIATADELAILLKALGAPYSDLTQQSNGSTVIPSSNENNQLLRRLKGLGIVTSFHKLKLGRGTKVYLAADNG